MTQADVLDKNNPVVQVSHVAALLQVWQVELHVEQAPWLKYFPLTHPGVQLYPFKRNPSEQLEHEV